MIRIVLAGSAADRARLRDELVDVGVDVVGEFASVAAARAAGLAADAILIATEPVERETLEIEEPLTPREIQVLELLAEGLSNKGIAERLGISDQTVKFHAASIMAKLGAANRTEAVRLAVRRGLVAL